MGPDGGPSPEVVVAASDERLAQDTAGRLAGTLIAALAVRPVAHVVLTGGGILERVLGALGDRAGQGDVDWRRVHVWWADERYVGSDSDERNDTAAFAAGLDGLPLDPALIHRMPAADSRFGDDVEAAARAYAAELTAAAPAEGTATAPHFDAVLLGVGPDGHCASLFPGHPGVYERGATVIAVHDSPKPPPTRLSFTFDMLDLSNEVWFVASGEGKADAVARALSGADRAQVPAAGPHGSKRTLWLIDPAAAARLP
ncbi:MAG: 6-phosphogluconolactonase [Actinomycetota bacterium]|nr:6-phosphogluconolactonase [Actinomycetota bacterium]